MPADGCRGLADRQRRAVCTHLQGCISDDHPLCLGPIGVHGLYTANTAIAECDMVLALGTRFDERSTTKSFENWKEPRVVVHVDITPQKVRARHRQGSRRQAWC